MNRNINKILLLLTACASLTIAHTAKADDTYFRYDANGLQTYAHYSDYEVFDTRDVNGNITYEYTNHFSESDKHLDYEVIYTRDGNGNLITKDKHYLHPAPVATPVPVTTKPVHITPIATPRPAPTPEPTVIVTEGEVDNAPLSPAERARLAAHAKAEETPHKPYKFVNGE